MTMALGGAAYITIISKFYTIGIKSAPKWIGARVLAVLLILDGSFVVGSVLWGTVANLFGISITLLDTPSRSVLMMVTMSISG